ncbi:hypothetical protein GY45DRAFT_176273 [Cubamyces sp. BRFM 1775]|nr:hypothetical protein GY45DRAFT_176273 [Cubamyces sp. BRFM 1775]
MTSTDRALTCVDILEEVFEWLILIPGRKHNKHNQKKDEHHVGRRALAHCARVCKVFFQPAVRVLWARLDSVFPILNTLPSLIMVSERSAYDRQAIYRLPEDVPSQEWDLLCAYAVHVKAIYIEKPPYTRKEGFTQDTWKSLRRLARNRPVCPNLRRFSWRMDELPGTPDDLIPFLGPSVTAMCIYCFPTDLCRFDSAQEHIWGTRLETLFSAVYERAVRLQQLWIYLDERMTPLVATKIPLSQYLLPTLRSYLLRCGTITFTDLVTLSGVATLELLELKKLDSGILQLEESPSRGPLKFKRLRTLCIRDLPISTSASIGLFKFSPLRSLRVDGIEYRDPDTLKRMFETWSHDFPSLEALSCGFCMPKVPLQRAGSLSTLLSPLRNTLPHLRTINLYLGGIPGVTIDDNDIIVLSEAWPLLKQLHLWAAKDKISGHTYGLLSLMALAKNCPHLEDLLLQRIVVRPEDLARLPADRPIHGLRLLKVKSPEKLSLGWLHDYRMITERIFPQLPSPPGEDMEELYRSVHASELPMNGD